MALKIPGSLCPRAQVGTGYECVRNVNADSEETAFCPCAIFERVDNGDGRVLVWFSIIRVRRLSESFFDSTKVTCALTRYCCAQRSFRSDRFAVHPPATLPRNDRCSRQQCRCPGRLLPFDAPTNWSCSVFRRHYCIEIQRIHCARADENFVDKHADFRNLPLQPTPDTYTHAVHVQRACARVPEISGKNRLLFYTCMRVMESFSNRVTQNGHRRCRRRRFFARIIGDFAADRCLRERTDFLTDTARCLLLRTVIIL